LQPHFTAKRGNTEQQGCSRLCKGFGHGQHS
jgi:hypothetical protein